MTKNVSLIFPLLLVFYEISTYLSNDMYLPAMPQLMNDLSLTAQQVQLTLTTWFIGETFLPAVSGALSDRFGRRPVLLWGALIYVVTTLICAFTSNFSVLLVSRFIEGSMISTMMVAGYSTIHELYDQKTAIRVLALMGSIVVLAPGFGPLLGSIALFFTNWRGIFVLIALSATIAGFLLYRFMPETLPQEKRHATNLHILTQQYTRVITNPFFIGYMCVLGFMFGGFITWISGGPLLVMNSFHESPFAFGILQGIIFTAYIIATRMLKHLVSKIEVFRLIDIGLSICVVGAMIAFLSAYLLPQFLYSFILGMTIYAFGSALSFSPLNRIIIESSTEPMGIRVGSFTIFFTSFAALGSGMSSLFFDGSSFSLATLLLAGIGISFAMYKSIRRFTGRSLTASMS